MKRRIRQGHTMWMTAQRTGPDGRVECVYVLDVFVLRVRGDRLYCRIGGDGPVIIYRENISELHKTRRAAWRKAWAAVREADRRRDAEYASAWNDG